MECTITAAVAANEMAGETAAIAADLKRKISGLNTSTIAWTLQWALQVPGPKVVGLSLRGRVATPAGGHRESWAKLSAEPNCFKQHQIDAAKPKAALMEGDRVIELDINGTIERKRQVGGYARMKAGRDLYICLCLQDPDSGWTGLYQLTPNGNLDFAGAFTRAAQASYDATMPGGTFTWRSIRLRRLTDTEIQKLLGGRTRFASGIKLP